MRGWRAKTRSRAASSAALPGKSPPKNDQSGCRQLLVALIVAVDRQEERLRIRDMDPDRQAQAAHGLPQRIETTVVDRDQAPSMPSRRYRPSVLSTLTPRDPARWAATICIGLQAPYPDRASAQHGRQAQEPARAASSKRRCACRARAPRRRSGSRGLDVLALHDRQQLIGRRQVCMPSPTATPLERSLNVRWAWKSMTGKRARGTWVSETGACCAGESLSRSPPDGAPRGRMGLPEGSVVPPLGLAAASRPPALTPDPVDTARIVCTSR